MGFDEGKHPRNENGEFSRKGAGSGRTFDEVKGDYELLKEIGVSDKGMTPEEVHRRAQEIRDKKKNIPTAHSFNRVKTKHHRQHVIAMGYRGEREYEQAAVHFFNDGEGEVYYSVRRDRYYRYDKTQKRIAVANSDGFINTYMDFSEKDFERIRRQDRLI